jgi:hypothetical protein
MESFADIVTAFPDGALSADLRVSAGLPAVWKCRNSIPSRYWPDLVASASKRRITGVTLTVLADLSKRKAA